MHSYRKYFTEPQLQQLAEAAPTWGVDIRTVGHNAHPPRKPYPDSDHPNHYYFDWEGGRVLDEFQLVYIAHGQGFFESDNQLPMLVEAGTAFLLYPNVRHRFRPSEETGWEEFWVGFTGHYAEYLMGQDCFSAQRPLIRMGFQAELLNVFTRLVDTMKYEGVAYQQIGTCLVIQLLGLVYASALIADTRRTDREQLIHQVRYRIQENWATAIDFEALSQEFNVSYIWFRKTFKAVMGIAPGQYHLNLKLEKARQMLQETALSVSEIAFQSGFESEFYFSRIFKKKLAITPSAFRKNGTTTSPVLP